MVPPARSRGPILKSGYGYQPARTPGLGYAAATGVSLRCPRRTSS